MADHSGAQPQGQLGGWRLSWWAASPQVMEELYLPPVHKRPRMNLSVIEESFQDKKLKLKSLKLTEIKIGNLKKYLASGIQIWIRNLFISKVTERYFVKSRKGNVTIITLSRSSKVTSCWQVTVAQVVDIYYVS